MSTAAPVERFPGFTEVRPLRLLGALEYLAARDGASGEPRVLVAAVPGP